MNRFDIPRTGFPCDYHMHTWFSGDSKADPQAQVREAIRLGMKEICFTDHMDLDYPLETELFLLDLAKYGPAMEAIQAEWAGVLTIKIGVEMGLQPHLEKEIPAFVESYPFDFVIGSTHVADGIDPYRKAFFEGRTEEEGYRRYFEVTLENIRKFDCFDVYGHLDYVVRYGPNRDREYLYESYKEILDEILRALILKGKGIEVNTAGLKYGLSYPHPYPFILQRYRELGGEILTVGADGHKPEQIAFAFSHVADYLRQNGIRYYCTFDKRKPSFHRL